MAFRAVLAAVFLSCMSCAATVTTDAYAQRPNGPQPVGGAWVELGRRDVDFHADRDVIAVGGQEGRFRAIQLQVTGNSIEFFALFVTFGDGTTTEIPVREIIRGGESTRVINLPGEARFLRSVELRYRSNGGTLNGRAHVRLRGMR